MSALLVAPSTSSPAQSGALTFEKIDASALPALQAIAKKTFDDAFRPQNKPDIMEEYLSQAFSKEQLLSELADHLNHFYLVKIDSTVVGYIKLTSRIDYTDASIPACIRNRHSIMIERFYLDTPYHGNGLAHRMMRECLDIAARMDYEQIWLGVWEENYKARRFYEKWSFAMVGSHPFMMGDEAQNDFWMVRAIY